MLIDTHVIFEAALPLFCNLKTYGTAQPTNLSRRDKSMFYVEVRELPNALFQNHLFCAREIRAPDRDDRPDASNLL